MTNKGILMKLTGFTKDYLGNIVTKYHKGSYHLSWVNDVLLYAYSQIAIFIWFYSWTKKIKPIYFYTNAYFTLIWHQITFLCAKIGPLCRKHKTMKINGEMGIYGGIFTRGVHSNFGKIRSRKVGGGHTESCITSQPLMIA